MEIEYFKQCIQIETEKACKIMQKIDFFPSVPVLHVVNESIFIVPKFESINLLTEANSDPTSKRDWF